jgi:thiol-disulfide isomerase/thioredoxin
MKLHIPAAIVLLAVACGSDGERFRPLAVGDAAPAYSARTLGADTIAVGSGEPLTLLHIWATWCGPCVEEFPVLEQLHQEFASRGVRLVAVSIDGGGDERVRQFVEEHGATFIIARDPTGIVRERFRSIGVPESYLIGSDGRLLWRHPGALPAGGAPARLAIERALGAAEARGDVRIGGSDAN